MPDKIDQLVTVFGGGGFIGRYVVQNLFQAGWRVRIVGRDPKSAWFLQPLGSLGQRQIVAGDVRDRASVARAVDGADAVINLVGILKGDFMAYHVDGAAAVARAAADAGAASLVHISAIGADPESPSAYGQSKGLGEAAVRDAFPAATIVRPSIVFGPEDNFVNRFAALSRQLPVLPVVGTKAKFQPVYVADLARAIAAAALEPGRYAGRTFELGGPQVMTMTELLQVVTRLAGRPDKTLAPIPDAIAGFMAKAFGWLPGAPITADQWQMLQVPNVVAEGAAGFEAFGIRPQPLAAIGATWLTAFRKGGRFSVKSPY